MQDIETFWSVVGKSAAIIGVIVAIIQGVKFLYAETPTAKLAKRVDGMGEKLDKDLHHLERHDREISELQIKTSETERKIEEMNNGIKMIGKSNILILRHMIDGDGVDAMKKEAEDLTEFFINR